MKVADFFVNIGIKGNVQVKNALSAVHSSLTDAKESSMGLKAGILGAVVALEEITRRSVTSAIDLQNFARATGLSTEELQKWNYWAEINNVKREEMTSTIKNLQSAQAALRLGVGITPGMLYFGLNASHDPLQMINDIQRKFHEIGNDQAKIAEARFMAKDLIGGDTMFGALRSGTVGFSGLTSQMMLTGEEIKKLTDLGKEWVGVWETISGVTQKTVGNNLAKPLTGFVHALRDAVVEIAELTDALSTAMNRKDFGASNLSTELKLAGAGMAAAGLIFAPFTTILIGLVAALNDFHKYTHGEQSDFFGNLSAIKGLLTNKEPKVSDYLTGPAKEKAEADERSKYNDAILNLLSFGFAGKSAQEQPAKQGDINITMHNNIDGVVDPEEIAKHFSTQVENAWWQNPAVNQGTPSK